MKRARPSRSGCLIATGALLTGVPVATHAGPAQTRSFAFDGTFTQTGGLTLSFSRPVATLDAQGNPVAPDAPRFAPDTLLCGALADVETVDANAGPRTYFSAHGVDADGQTPLSIVVNQTDRRIDTYVGPNATLHASRTLVGEGTFGAIDLLENTIPGRDYAPNGISICHGLIVATCSVATDIGTPQTPNWNVRRNAILVSTDRADSWTIVYERDADFPEPDDDVTRFSGGGVANQNWWALDDAGDPPTTVWFPITDYRNPPKDGGDLVLLRAQRASPTAPWTIDPAQDIERILSIDGQNGMHFHAAGITRHGPTGLAVLLLVGDFNQSMVVKLTRDDDNFTQGPASITHASAQNGWYTFEAHGPRTAVLLDDGGVPTIKPIRANQGLGLAPGPDPGSFLVCGDEASSVITRFDHDHQPDTALTFRPVFEPTTSRHGKWISFKMHNADPIAGGPYVANARHVPSPGGVGALGCAIFSPDGRHFAPFAPQMRSPHKESGLTPTHYWWNDEQNVYRVAHPVTRLMRPLMVGPGGANLLQPVVPSTFSNGDGIVRTTISTLPPGVPPVQSLHSPHYLFESDAFSRADLGDYTLTTGEPISLGDTVHFKYHCYHFPYDGGTAGGYDPLAPGQGANPRAGGWLCQSVFGEPTPNRPFSNAQGGFGFMASDAWIPLATASDSDDWQQPDLSSSPVFDLRMLLRAGGTGSGMWDKRIVAFESASVDDYLAYPIAPGQTGPDEVVEVNGLDTGLDWTVYLAGQVPHDNFDFESGRDEQPIASIVDDAGGFIEVVARPRSNTLDIEIYTPLSPTIPAEVLSLDVHPFKRCHPLMLAIRKVRDTVLVKIVAAGQPTITAASLVPEWAFFPLSPETIRLGTARPDRRSGAFWWFGGAIDDGATSATDIDDALTSLSFLDTSGATAACNLDGGDVDLADLLLFLQLYFSDDPGAELDGRPGITVGDLLTFLQCWFDS